MKTVLSNQTFDKAGNTFPAFLFFQPKLTINQPNDIYEQEADAVADKVMRMPANGKSFFKPNPVSVSQLQRKCKDCEDEEKLQRKENTAQSTEAGSETGTYINSLSSKGSPLSKEIQDFFEPRFEYDSSGVRIHTDAEAAQSAQSINALAYTAGNNVVFNQNQFSPETDKGKQLLAHELTHVVQQKENNENTVKRKPAFNEACDNYHRCLVIEAMPAAKQLVDNVIKKVQPVANGNVTKGDIVYQLNFHFKEGAIKDAAVIVDNYRQIRAELDNKVKYNCFEKEPDECKSDKGRVGALTDFSKGVDIDLCSFYFSMNCAERGRELVHENAHHLGFSNDFAYADDDNYVKLSHEDAMKNPDTYAEFAKSIYQGTTSCKDCAEEIQVKNKKY